GAGHAGAADGAAGDRPRHGPSRKAERRHRLHAARPRAERAGDRGRAQRLRCALDEAPTESIAAGFVYALPRGGPPSAFFPAALPLCARLHANQARAIAKGDADAAARASDKLLDYVESFTRATVSV